MHIGHRARIMINPRSLRDPFMCIFVNLLSRHAYLSTLCCCYRPRFVPPNMTGNQLQVAIVAGTHLVNAISNFFLGGGGGGKHVGIGGAVAGVTLDVNEKSKTRSVRTPSTSTAPSMDFGYAFHDSDRIDQQRPRVRPHYSYRTFEI
jgi:hypothetical protein